MAEIREVVSEQLQATIRRLLPSQKGFTEDLQASNVITPIIDLTPTAEGSSLPEYLQNALAFGSQTEFTAAGGSTDIISNAGFWRVTGSVNLAGNSASIVQAAFGLFDGATFKTIYNWRKLGTTSFSEFFTLSFDIVVYLRAGETLRASNSTTNADIRGSYRQLADVNGVLTNPAGFSPQ